MQQSQPAKSYGVLDLLWDIRDAHSICKKDALAKSILWALASRSDSKKGFTCYPSMGLLAGDVQASERTIRDHMKTLLTEKLIGRTRRYDDSYLYCVCVDEIRAAAEKQRKLWSAEKETQSAHDEAFEKAVKANTTVSATPSALAEDAAPPEAKSKTLVEYADALAEGIQYIEALAEKISAGEAQSFAASICSKYAGSAPAIAVSRLSDEAIIRAANAKTPVAYLRTTLTNKIDELCAKPYTKDESAIERFADEMLKGKDGSGGFYINVDQHPHWADDRIAAIGRREGGILNSPYRGVDEVGEAVLVFGWSDYTERKEPTDDEIADPNAPEDDSTDIESESASPALDEDEDDGFTTTPVAKPATPVSDFEDDIHQINYEAVSAPEPTPKVVPVVVAPVMAPPPVKPEPEYRADLELKALFRKMPTGRTEATFRLPDDHQDELIEYLRTTFGDDCSISDRSAWIAAHRANRFLRADRFLDPYAKERTMFDSLVAVVENQCKQSFAAIVRDFNLGSVKEFGISREQYKAWVGDRYSDYVSVSDSPFGADHFLTKVSLHKGVKLLQFAEHLKNNPFTAPMPPSTTKSASSMLA
jgi:hypothetical protein